MPRETHLIWAHGEGCYCDNCKNGDNFSYDRCMVHDRDANEVISTPLPTKVMEPQFWRDQHGNEYKVALLGKGAGA